MTIPTARSEEPVPEVVSLVQQVFELRLYLAGHGPKSLRAIENLRALCEQYLPGQYTIELVDLLEDPQRARGDGIIALPTLVRRLPEPIRRIIGDLSDTDRVLAGLQLRPETAVGL